VYKKVTSVICPKSMCALCLETVEYDATE